MKEKVFLTIDILAALVAGVIYEIQEECDRRKEDEVLRVRSKGSRPS
jgi:hypothetical protein